MALPQLLGGLAERDRPLRAHGRVDEAPAERRRRQREIACGIRLLGLGQHPGGPRHRLHPADDDDVRLAGRDLSRGDHRRVETGPAEPVDGRAGDRGRQAGEQGRHACHVAVVLTGTVGVAEDDLVDVLGCPVAREPGGARDEGAHDQGGEVVGTGRGEGATEAPERGADSVVDEGVVHPCTSSQRSVMVVSFVRSGEHAMSETRDRDGHGAPAWRGCSCDEVASSVGPWRSMWGSRAANARRCCRG